MNKELVLLVDGSMGIYIPQLFANTWEKMCFVNDLPASEDGAMTENIGICKFGPDHDEYNEAWEEVERNATIDIEGVKYTLHQDGDLWAVPPGYEWPEQ